MGCAFVSPNAKFRITGVCCGASVGGCIRAVCRVGIGNFRVADVGVLRRAHLWIFRAGDVGLFVGLVCESFGGVDSESAVGMISKIFVGLSSENSSRGVISEPCEGYFFDGILSG